MAMAFSGMAVSVIFAVMTVSGMVVDVMGSAVASLMCSGAIERQQSKDQRSGDRQQRRRPPTPQMKVIHIGSSSLATRR
jgi:hypothetical protein